MPRRRRRTDSEKPAEPAPPGEPFERRRLRMVGRDIVGQGISDRRVVHAMSTVRRHRFVPEELAFEAYENRPLPIGAGQTVSQPYIVALMAEAAEIAPRDRVLEIGTGSGYGAAVLGCLAGEVWTIERHEELAGPAQEALQAEGMGNVHVVTGDGTRGWPAAAPFDAILVTAAGPEVPPALLDQLADGGRLIMPVGRRNRTQTLVRIRRSGDRINSESLGPVRFVPLVGDG